MKSLEGKVAIVTSSSRCIGQAIAQRLAQDGVAVVINYAHSRGQGRGEIGNFDFGGIDSFELCGFYCQARLGRGASNQSCHTTQ